MGGSTGDYGSHDYSIEDKSSGSPKHGLMFPPQNGVQKTSLHDYPTIPPRQLSSGEFTQAEAPAEIEQVFFQEDFRGGLGGFNSRLHPRTYAIGAKVETDFDGAMILARRLFAATADTNPTVFKPSGFAKVGTEEWAFMERQVYVWDYTNKQWDLGTTPAATAVVYRNGVEYKGNTYVPSWLASTDVADTYIYKADADANWTLSTLTPKTCKYMDVVDDKLYGANWGSATTNEIRSSTDGTNSGSWTAAVAIGQTDSPITAIVGDGDTLLVCKTDGIYAFYADSSQRNLTPEFKRQAHPDNFRGAFNWNGHILLPLGAGGMMELVGGQLVNIEMKLYAPLQTTLHGRVMAIHGNPQHLFCLVLDTTNLKYHLLKAVWQEFDGDQDYRWHHMGTIAYTTSTVAEHAALLTSGVPSGTTIHNRVLVGVESGGSNLLPRYLPQDNDDEVVYNSGASDADALAASWESADYDGHHPSMNKQFSEATFITDNLGSGANDHYIEVDYRIDGGSYQTDMTGGTGATNRLTADSITLQFPAEQFGKTVTFKFKPVRGTTTTTTPKLVSFTLRNRLRPAPIKSIPLRAYLVNGMIMRNGARENQAKTKIAQLRTWNAGGAEVLLKTADGQSIDAVFLPGAYKETEIYRGKHFPRGYIVDFVLGAV